VITFDVDDVIGRGVLHDRERVPLGLHGGADVLHTGKGAIGAGLPAGIRRPDRRPEIAIPLIGPNAVLVGQTMEGHLSLEPVQALAEAAHSRVIDVHPGERCRHIVSSPRTTGHKRQASAVGNRRM